MISIKKMLNNNLRHGKAMHRFVKQFKSDLETLDSDADILCWRPLSLINKSLMN